MVFGGVPAAVLELSWGVGCGAGVVREAGPESIPAEPDPVNAGVGSAQTSQARRFTPRHADGRGSRADHHSPCGTVGAGTAQTRELMQPTVLTIAGSDSSGGAGIQADLKAITANGGYGASVITAITAQNTQRVAASETVSLDLLRAQLAAVFDDLQVAAIKSGMLATEEVIAIVAEALRVRRPRHYVLDPVMISKSGHRLLAERSVDGLVSELLPLASLVTPNVHEAAVLGGTVIRTPEDAERAGRTILERGARAVLVKGGHLDERPATDVLVTPEGAEWFAGTAIDTPHTHGTGCTHSAAIATQLAHGRPLTEAVRIAKEFVTEAIRHGFAVGGGCGPTDPFFFLRGVDGGARWLSRLRDPEPGGARGGSTGPPRSEHPVEDVR